MFSFSIQNGDSPLHIASAMGRKKLTVILLSSGCKSHLRNHQRENPLDISIRKGFDEVTAALNDPPEVVTPLERDELRASKHTTQSSSSKSRELSREGRRRGSSTNKKRESSSSTRGSLGQKSKQSSRRSSSKDSPATSSKNIIPVLTNGHSKAEFSPKWSPYGCHFHPNPSAFPAPNIDSLPEEPLSRLAIVGFCTVFVFLFISNFYTIFEGWIG